MLDSLRIVKVHITIKGHIESKKKKGLSVIAHKRSCTKYIGCVVI